MYVLEYMLYNMKLKIFHTNSIHDRRWQARAEVSVNEFAYSMRKAQCVAQPELFVNIICLKLLL